MNSIPSDGKIRRAERLDKERSRNLEDVCRVSSDILSKYVHSTMSIYWLKGLRIPNLCLLLKK